jgi:hypothetical protein
VVEQDAAAGDVARHTDVHDAIHNTSERVR